ncbi:MAG: FAD-dependent oxidoreductase, partial [Candidatus Bathyarchaeia archaeon]
AEGVKKTVSVPVITVGRFNDPEVAEKILREGKADFVAMGRALVADPELPKKARQGRVEDIRYCTGCTRGCIGRLLVGGLRISCDVNPAVGKEREYELKPTTRIREVLVVGGGPGGMEAARVAALRGHRVTLLERGSRLGGQLLLATASPYKGEVKRLLNYLSKQVEKAGVSVELNTLATVEMVLARKPDVVIVATGAQPLIPDIPGADGKNVATAWDVLSGAVDVGEDAAVVGGGIVGCEAAEFLVEKGKKVHVVEMLNDIALDMPPRARAWLLQRFQQQGIMKLVDSKVHEITDAGVVIESNGQRRLVEAGNVVVAMGSKPDSELAEALRDKLDELYDIGDCVKPRQMMEAIHEGSHVARII